VSLVLGLLAWLVFAAACALLSRRPRPGDPFIGLLYQLVRVYAWVRHKLEVRGVTDDPRHNGGAGGGGLIIVCNHTAGIDPSLVQAACEFEIRWMMAKDMMIEQFEWAWEWLAIIPVDRNSNRDTSAAREAIRHVLAGGVVGVFPEGRIENPPRMLLPFKAGVGLLVLKTGAPVLPVWIDGTPIAARAWGSLFLTSRSRVTFGPVMRFAKGGGSAEITASIQRWFEEASGWAVAPGNEG